MSGSLPSFPVACVGVLMLTFLVSACTAGGNPTDVGWVNVSVSDAGTRIAASFVVAQQQCDRQEVADCVIQRCRPVEPRDRVDGGAVNVTSASLKLQLDSDPEHETAPAPYAWAAVEEVADEGEVLEFDISGSRHVPTMAGSLRVPPAVAVPRCNMVAAEGPIVMEAGRDIELDWTEGAEGHMLVRLVPQGGHEPEPHLKPDLVAICQYDAAASVASVAAPVSAALDTDRVELHVDLVSLALIETASARVALSITRDVCAPRVIP